MNEKPPPRGAGFKKGQSGNPGGRPKEQKEIVALARENSTMAINRLVYWAQSDNAKASVPACMALLDRAFGKPKQTIETGEQGFTIQVITGVPRNPGE